MSLFNITQAQKDHANFYIKAGSKDADLCLRALRHTIQDIIHKQNHQDDLVTCREASQPHIKMAIDEKIQDIGDCIRGLADNVNFHYHIHRLNRDFPLTFHSHKAFTPDTTICVVRGPPPLSTSSSDEESSSDDESSTDDESEEELEEIEEIPNRAPNGRFKRQYPSYKRQRGANGRFIVR